MTPLPDPSLINRPVVDLEARTIHPLRPAAVMAMLGGPVVFCLYALVWGVAS